MIAYASRSLHPTDQNDENYSLFKLELLTLKWAVVDTLKDYLFGASFTIFTDNNPLAHLKTAKLGAVEQRWAAQLANYQFIIQYWLGKENTNADVLSRLSAEHPWDVGVEGSRDAVDVPGFQTMTASVV